jgi:hypothetical protein
MALMEPKFNLTASKRFKQGKFRSAEHAKQYRALEESWQQLQAQYKPKVKTQGPGNLRTLPTIPRRTQLDGAQSLSTGTGSTAPQPSPQYSGTAMMGIGTLHKSNAVPIFSQEEAVDISKMRRG